MFAASCVYGCVQNTYIILNKFGTLGKLQSAECFISRTAREAK